MKPAARPAARPATRPAVGPAVRPTTRPVVKTRLSTKTLMWSRFVIGLDIRSTMSPVAGLIRRSTKIPMLMLAVDPTARSVMIKRNRIFHNNFALR